MHQVQARLKRKELILNYRFLKVQNRRAINILKIKTDVLWIIMSFSIWNCIAFDILSQVEKLESVFGNP